MKVLSGLQDVHDRRQSTAEQCLVPVCSTVPSYVSNRPNGLVDDAWLVFDELCDEYLQCSLFKYALALLVVP